MVLQCPSQILQGSAFGEAVAKSTTQNPRSHPFCSLQTGRAAASNRPLQTALGQRRTCKLPRTSALHPGSSRDVLTIDSKSGQWERLVEIHYVAENPVERLSYQRCRMTREVFRQSSTHQLKTVAILTSEQAEEALVRTSLVTALSGPIQTRELIPNRFRFLPMRFSRQVRVR